MSGAASVTRSLSMNVFGRGNSQVKNVSDKNRTISYSAMVMAVFGIGLSSFSLKQLCSSSSTRRF